MSLIYNATFDSQTRVLSLLDKAGNVISSCEVPSKDVDDITKPLTFKATQDGSTVRLSTGYGSPSGDFQTSRDGGNTWVDYTENTTITLNTGDEVSFRAKSNRTSQLAGSYFKFSMTGKIEAWHNVMSLYRTNDFATYNTVMQYAFNMLFEDCTSLTKAPVLPATTLAVSCYDTMFKGCTSLTNAPVLPATTLADYCYFSMFNGCNSLTKAPVLPATTLADRCYGFMFNGCSSLNEVHCHMPSLYSSSQISSYADTWLSGVSSTGTFYTNEDANWTSGASGIPTGWTRVNEGAPDVDDITKPLTFRATQDGSTVALIKNGSPSGSFQTSRDGGNTWSDYTIGTSITLNTGDKVSFRAKADRSSAQSTQNYFNFSMKGKIEAWHNVMSLYRTNDFATYESVVVHAFYRLFRECTSLIKSPALPATTLASGCYTSMFSGCTSLAKNPALPATTLASGCTSLAKNPALPATTLASGCYQYMFWGCRSLTKALALPATTLADKCYYQMFYGCSSLNEVRCKMPSSYSSSQISSYANNWLYGVSSTGTFYTNVDAKWSSGASGIPTSWTRVNEGAPAVDDPKKPLMLRAIEDNSSVTLTKNGTLDNTYQTSTNGTDWTDYTLGTQISLNNGESVYFRCSNHPTTQTSSNYVRFVMGGKIEAWHNAYSMISSDFSSAEGSVGEYGMTGLFEFCTSLTKAPLLLNALGIGCYYGTFYDCRSLTKAPSLPATNLAEWCYQKIFWNCSSLTKAPELPATNLTKGCYYNMFSNCSKLKEVRIAATTTAEESLGNWLSGVSATGDFYCDPNAKIFPSGVSGIPANWTRHALADYPVTP